MIEETTGRRERSPIDFGVQSLLAIEKLRVAAQGRETHLKLQGRSDEFTDRARAILARAEDDLTALVAPLIIHHPAYPWFSRVKGIGKENIAKVIADVDIERAQTVSALWKFAGMSVENGKAPRQEKGVKSTYNARLRTMCWRLGNSLLRAKGKFYAFYLQAKAEEVVKAESQGLAIVKGHKGGERPGEIAEGHIHNRAMRRMIKLFLALLWHSWREAEGLNTVGPYAQAILKHGHIYQPEDFVEKPSPRRNPEVQSEPCSTRSPC